MQDVIATARIPWARWPDFSRYVDEVRRLYSARTHTLIWFDGPLVSHAGDAAIAALLSASEHGLDPSDYDAEALARLAQHSGRPLLSQHDRARFDLLLSVDLIRFLDDLQSGRLHYGPLGSPGRYRGLHPTWRGQSGRPSRVTRSRNWLRPQRHNWPNTGISSAS